MIDIIAITPIKNISLLIFMHFSNLSSSRAKPCADQCYIYVTMSMHMADIERASIGATLRHSAQKRVVVARAARFRQQPDGCPATRRYRPTDGGQHLCRAARHLTATAAGGGQPGAVSAAAFVFCFFSFPCPILVRPRLRGPRCSLLLPSSTSSGALLIW